MTKTHDQLWKDACKALQAMLNPDLFARWFAPIQPVEITDDTLHLGVANEFSQIWLQDNFLALVREAVNQASQQPLQVKFVIAAGTNAKVVFVSDKSGHPQVYVVEIATNQSPAAV